MFLGASLNPSYFKEKINLFIALAPVASTQYLKVDVLRAAANHIKVLQFGLVRTLGFYNWFPPVSEGSAALDTFCVFEPTLCETLASFVFDPEIDNMPRMEMGVGDLPAGQTYRAMVYYSQSINGSYRFSMYDYGAIKNKQIYGTKEPPVVPLDAYDIPTAFQSGSRDAFAPPEDVSWLTEQLGDKIVFNKEYDLNHMGFAIANDMSFFSVDAVALL